jgi:hypothetical protein
MSTILKSPADATDYAALSGRRNPDFKDVPSEQIMGRYRATFKHRFNEAELPRSTEFSAQPSAARAEALRQASLNEVVVDVVPLI